MIFQHTLSQVLDGTKTETRRLWKPEWAFDDGSYDYHGNRIGTTRNVYSRLSNGKRRYVYCVRNDYAIQARRGLPAVWIAPDGTIIDGISEHDGWNPYTIYDAANIEYFDKSPHFIWEPERIHTTLIEAGYREARFRLLDLCRENLQDITEAGAKAEGGYTVASYRDLWNSIHKPGNRWQDNPAVLVLKFELVENET